jgi:uncharacterized phage protein (TIGR01671 family)
MRTIKFRGKRIDTGEWVEGDLVQFKHFNGTKFDDVVAISLQHHDSGKFEVDPSTVGQFTGLVDKNGREIFEGDILQGVSNNAFSKGLVNKYEIMWGIDHWHAYRTNFTLQELFDYCANNITVIGNIHDNKDLL